MTTTIPTSPISQLNGPIKEKLNRLLSRAKGQLFAMPGAAFLGSLLCNHRFVWDLDIPTANCNGKTIRINPNFFITISPDTRVALVAHELWHTGYGHMIRRGARCPRIWNYAADIVINNRLDDQGYVLEFGFDIWLDHDFDGWTTEQVYDQLIDNGMVPFTNPPGSLPMDGDVIEVEGEGAAQTRIDVKATISQAQQAAKESNQAGSMPGEIKVFIQNFLRPRLPWQTILRKFFTDLSKDDYSWRRPNRRFDDMYLPSLIGDNGLARLNYYMDVSGSMTQDQLLFTNSEVRGIHKNLQPEHLTLATFDTQIQDVYEFKKGQPFNGLSISGRGGTGLECVYDHIQQTKPTAAVIFSDMYVRMMKENPKVPLVWIVVDHEDVEIPFGKVIHVREEDLRPAA